MGEAAPGPGRHEDRAWEVWRETAAGDPDGHYSGMFLSFMQKGKEEHIFLRMRTPGTGQRKHQERLCVSMVAPAEVGHPPQGLDTFQRRVL